jgi:Icc-related predicted phosphoesterase
MIRIAAVGDVHFGDDSAGSLRPHLEHLPERADALLLAGDVTRHGLADEAVVLAEELRDLELPVVAVLGNHDYHQNEEKPIRDVLEGAGIQVLEGETATIEANDDSVGIAGIKGFGGGFAGACGTEFGEPEMKSYIRHTRETAERLGEVLKAVEGNHRVVLLHYSPIPDTLQGERLEIYPFLGSYLLAEAIDAAPCDLVLHGHAHAGSEKGMTPGGVLVRNVAQPLIGSPYNVYCLGADDDLAC